MLLTRRWDSAFIRQTLRQKAGPGSSIIPFQMILPVGGVKIFLVGSDQSMGAVTATVIFKNILNMINFIFTMNQFRFRAVDLIFLIKPGSNRR